MRERSSPADLTRSTFFGQFPGLSTERGSGAAIFSFTAHDSRYPSAAGWQTLTARPHRAELQEVHVPWLEDGREQGYGDREEKTKKRPLTRCWPKIRQIKMPCGNKQVGHGTLALKIQLRFFFWSKIEQSSNYG